MLWGNQKSYSKSISLTQCSLRIGDTDYSGVLRNFEYFNSDSVFFVIFIVESDEFSSKVNGSSGLCPQLCDAINEFTGRYCLGKKLLRIMHPMWEAWKNAWHFSPNSNAFELWEWWNANINIFILLLFVFVDFISERKNKTFLRNILEIDVNMTGRLHAHTQIEM